MEDGDKPTCSLALVDVDEAKRWPLEIDETFDLSTRSGMPSMSWA